MFLLNSKSPKHLLTFSQGLCCDRAGKGTLDGTSDGLGALDSRGGGRDRIIPINNTGDVVAEF